MGSTGGKILAEAQCAGVSDEGPSFKAGLGAARSGQVKGLMSPLPTIGLIALFTVTRPRPHS